MRLWIRWILAGVAGIAAHGAACAQETTLADALLSLNARAGIVFRGQVKAITRGHDTVRVAFAVDEVFSGAASATVTLNEWAGLWRGVPRYQIGERAVVFAYLPGVGGFATTVDGMEGVLPVQSNTATGGPLVDVARLNAGVVRTKGSPLPSASAITLADMREVIAPQGLGIRPVGPRQPVTPVRPATVPPVIALRAMPTPERPLAQ